MKLKDMKIYIVTIDSYAYTVFKTMFLMYKNVEVVKEDFVSFMNKYPNVECIVSPANAYGHMDGGYDAAISDYLGWDFQNKVQQYIKDHYYGEQIVGTSFIIEAPYNKKLIHTPTMIVPEIIKDKRVVYLSMRSSLICALQNNINSLVLPPFGAGTGEVKIEDAAKMMIAGYKQILDAENLNYTYFDERKY